MKSLNTLTGDALEQMIDYKVVDQTGASIGTLHSLWSDPTTGAVEFLGVKTGWLFGHNHVVPAEKAELDDAESIVRLPYAEAFIKEAPSMSADAEISEAEEDEIFRYYGLPLRGGGTAAGGATVSGDPYAPTPGATATAEEEEDLDPSATFVGIPTKLKETAAKDISITESGATTTNNYRLRRTSRPDLAGTAPENKPELGGMLSPTNDDFINGGAAAITTGVGAGADEEATESSRSPLGDTSVQGSTLAASEISGSSMTTLTTGTEEYTGTDEGRSFGATDPAANPDPITGEPGAHPIGAGAGAVAAGAAGAAIGGTLGGPVGAVVGAVAGGIGGGLAGKGVAEAIDPTEEGGYWAANYRNTPYYEQEYTYEDYHPAYRVGYEGYARHAAGAGDAGFAGVETHLQKDYEDARGTSKLDWEKAKHAARDAWNRASEKVVKTIDTPKG